MSPSVLPPHPGPIGHNAPPQPLPGFRFTLHNEGPLLFPLLRRFPAPSMIGHRILLISPIEVWGNGEPRPVSEYQVVQQRQRRIQGALTARGAICLVGRNFPTFHAPQPIRLAVIPYDPVPHLSTPYQRVAAALAGRGWRIISERDLVEAICFCDTAFERGPSGPNGPNLSSATGLRGPGGWRYRTSDVPLGSLSRSSGRGVVPPRGNYSTRGGWSDQAEAGTDYHRESFQSHHSVRGRGDGSSSARGVPPGRGPRGYRGAARGRVQPGHRRYQNHHHPHHRRPRLHEDADSSCRSDTEDEHRQRTRSRSPPHRPRASCLRPDSPPFVPQQALPPRFQCRTTVGNSKYPLNPRAKPFVPRFHNRALSEGSSSSSSGSSRMGDRASSPPTTVNDPPRLRADSPPFVPGRLWGSTTATSAGLRWAEDREGGHQVGGLSTIAPRSCFGESGYTHSTVLGFETPYPPADAYFGGDPADPWFFGPPSLEVNQWVPPDSGGQLWLPTPDQWSTVPPLQVDWAAPLNSPAPPHFGYPDVVPPHADMANPPMPWNEPYFTPWSESTTINPVVPEPYGQPLFLHLPPPPPPPIWVTAPSPILSQNGYSSDGDPHFHLPLNLMDSPSCYSPVPGPTFRPVQIRRPRTDITPPLSPPPSEIDHDAPSAGAGEDEDEDPLADLYVDLHHKIRGEMYGRKSWKSYQEVRARRTVSSPATLPRSVACPF